MNSLTIFTPASQQLATLVTIFTAFFTPLAVLGILYTMGVYQEAYLEVYRNLKYIIYMLISRAIFILLIKDIKEQSGILQVKKNYC